MIRCIPKGLCSWDFLLEDDGYHASVEFLWLIENGTVEVDGQSLDVRKHGVLSGNFPTVCFAFWLTVLSWRRTARNG